MLAYRPFVLISLIIFGVCFANGAHDGSSEEVSPNCDDGLAAVGLAKPCSMTTKTPATTTPDADWCRLSNGTTLALGYTFLYRNCSLCECTRSKTIRCQPLQCLPTYCVDGSTPGRREGYCCGQCKTDTSSESCLHNGINYPHGTVMKSIEGKMQCWCQWGQIECRPFISGLFGGIDVLSDSAILPILAMILIVVLIFGLLICCSCTVFIYYYVQRNQDTIQQAYDQYVNSLGWQPMEEEGVEGTEEKPVEEYPVEMYDTAAQKQAEAEQNQQTQEIIPPPYAMYDQTNANKDKE